MRIILCLVALPVLVFSTPGFACISSVGQPTKASSNNFGCLEFYDNFGSLSTFDVTNNNSNSRFNWYGTNYVYPGNNTPSSDYSISGNALTINDSNATAGLTLQSAAPVNAGARTFNGHTFQPPFYITYQDAVQQSLAPGVQKFTNPGCGIGASGVNRVAWPVVWLMDQGLLADQTTQSSGSGYPLAEIDILEFVTACPSGEGSSVWSPASNVFNWNAWNTTTTSCNNSISPSGPWDGSTLHTEELVVQTVASGGGTGSATFYHDGTQSAQCTWTGSPGTAVDNSNFVLILAAGYSWPIKIANVQVWGKGSPSPAGGLAANDNDLMLGEKRRVAAR